VNGLNSRFLVGALAWAVATPGARPDAPAAPVNLRVMTLNVEWGGENVAFDRVVEAVRVAGADLVGVQEPQGNIERLAAALGFPHSSRRLHVVSRFPLVELPVDEARYVLVEVAPGRVVALGNVHLPSDPYGPDLVRQGSPPEAVLDLERRTRLPEISGLLPVLGALAAAGTPVFLTGDFNAPSFRDWTPATVGSRPHVRYPLDWPVSRAVEAAGFRDTYRVAHPDPRAEPGLTWWARRPRIREWNPAEDDPADRIDLLYAGGPAEVLASRIVGERGAPGVDVAVDPWPTDHRGVVTTLSVLPSPLPPLVAVERQGVELGGEVRVRYCCPGLGAAALLVRRGEAGGAATSHPLAAPVAGLGRVALPTAGLQPGPHDAVVRDAAGRELGRAPFWIAPRGGGVELEPDAARHPVGQPIVFRWRYAPGNKYDWIGLYPAAASDPAQATQVLWQHVGARVTGELAFDRAVNGGSWPLPAGRYVAYLLEDDGYRPLARTEVVVGDGTAP
jgi:endonuclease/exonuclease/phosphatase family metal-dependent hydrolase